MESSIAGIFLKNNRPTMVNIFGYKSKGYPGINLVGPNYYIKSLREKLIYITKSRHIPIPLGRYMICIDLSLKELKSSQDLDLGFLDFPILLLFWKLIEVLKIMDLKGCLASAQITSYGCVQHLASLGSLCQYSFLQYYKNDQFHNRGVTYIGLEEVSLPDGFLVNYIDSQTLLSHIPLIKQNLYDSTTK
jgi:hypothetical protein